MLGELPIDKYVTHTFEGLDKVNDLVHTMHEGACLRGVVNINEYSGAASSENVRVVKSQKYMGGVIKTVEHKSSCNDCTMTFTIFLPEGEINQQRREPYPALYFLSGITSTWENATVKMMYARQARERGIAMVFCDTSPRGVDATCPEAGDADWTRGYGAGHYCNATQAPWNRHFNMFTYVTEELPSVVERYFHVDATKKSIMGFSMGGHGALMISAKLPTNYRSVTALCPITQSTQCAIFCKTSMEAYFGSEAAGADFSLIEILKKSGDALKLPPCFIDVAKRDDYLDHFNWPGLTAALRENGHKAAVNWHEGYDHSYFFVNSVIEKHIDFHAMHLYSH